MYDELMTDAVRKRVNAAVAEDPNVLPSTLAEEIGVAEGVVAACLPVDMCVAASVDAFEDVWTAMTRWEKVMFLAVTPGAIVEVKGRLPRGNFGHGFFNIGAGDNPLAGHLMIDRLRAICFVSKPIMGMESHSVRFYDKQGALMFAVHVGREGRTLIPSVLNRFMRLRDRFRKEAAA